jgi:hypothetical protein
VSGMGKKREFKRGGNLSGNSSIIIIRGLHGVIRSPLLLRGKVINPGAIININSRY